MSEPLFAFDLDGTLTTEEILPRIAERAGLAEMIARLTDLTLTGAIPFETSFRLRFSLLDSVPLAVIQDVVRRIPLDRDIVRFISRRRSRCVIVTGNLDRWIAPLVRKLGCECLCSRSRVNGGRLELVSVLHKGNAIRDLRKRHAGSVVAVGDSVNDIPMFEASHFGIAFAGVHDLMPEVARRADATVSDGTGLCQIMSRLESSEASAS